MFNPIENWTPIVVASNAAPWNVSASNSGVLLCSILLRYRPKFQPWDCSRYMTMGCSNFESNRTGTEIVS